MKAIAYAYHADLYCPDCGADLPDVDPEGNEKAAVFHGESIDYIPYCAGCGLCIEGYSLTKEGVWSAIDFLVEAALRLNIGTSDDAIEDALRYLQPYGEHLTVGERCLIEAVYAGDDGAAYAIAKYYREVDGDDVICLPRPLQEYWPYL